MLQLDKTDFILIGIALLAFMVHIVYSRYKKMREDDENRRIEKNPPQVWSAQSDEESEK
ncbi:hypothetical protein ACLI07_23060 (plasmid) [Providencia huaxiensis]|uniref:Uncharacterized protein n=7 Tax=Enterobacterales TaxID=91347 RepID=A0A7L8KA62_ECOLX|nr:MULTISPECIES: hypothetical protein [Enterobacterales]ELB1214883.1 hypothetical protein [Proteus mirabilis]ELY4881525.1 hypothetical protein [Morganella morganii]SPY66525.1 Uncharacterised protein [Providencia stuartii]ELR5094324.1 hypothetical protein [Providencia rettgeri]ELR5243173.1 hypothetical protein [Providencia rettgeri]